MVIINKVIQCLSKNSKLFLSVMALVISIVGIRISAQQTAIYEQQVLPHFNIMTYYGQEKVEERIANINLQIDNNSGYFYGLDVDTAEYLDVEYGGLNYQMPIIVFL